MGDATRKGQKLKDISISHVLCCGRKRRVMAIKNGPIVPIDHGTALWAADKALGSKESCKCRQLRWEIIRECQKKKADEAMENLAKNIFKPDPLKIPNKWDRMLRKGADVGREVLTAATLNYNADVLFVFSGCFRTSVRLELHEIHRVLFVEIHPFWLLLLKKGMGVVNGNIVARIDRTRDQKEDKIPVIAARQIGSSVVHPFPADVIRVYGNRWDLRWVEDPEIMKQDCNF